MLIKDCSWCGQDFPSPIDTEELDGYMRYAFNLPATREDIQRTREQIVGWLPDIELETMTADMVAMGVYPHVFHIWIHSTCREPFMRSLNTLLKLMGTFDLSVVKHSFYKMLIERHRLEMF